MGFRTGPELEITTADPNTVAALSSNSCTPTSPADNRAAAIADPITTSPASQRPDSAIERCFNGA